MQQQPIFAPVTNQPQYGVGQTQYGPGQVLSPPLNAFGASDPPPAYQFASAQQLPGPPDYGRSSPQPSYYPGLEPLTNLDQLFIKQEITDVFFNSRNNFKVLASSGQPIYAIVEKTGALMRLFGGQHQSFSLIMKDLGGNDIIFMEGSPGFWGGGAGISVSYQNMRIGAVQQGGDMCNPQYNIIDQNGQTVLIVKSQDGCCCMGVGGTAEFFILTPDGSQIGRIGKEWGGFGREFFTNADTFGINFPMDLHVSIKAVLLATTIMIDFQFFERR